MQIVGKRCQICGKKITLALEVRGCEPCGQVFHDACLDSSLACPSCATPFPVAERKRADPDFHTCPVCGAISPPSALACECGQDLRSGKSSQLRRENIGQAKLWILSGVGMIGLSVMISAVTMFFKEGGGTGVIFYGLFFAGCGVIANGYRKFHRLR